jgi:hypothetical protein
MYLCGKGPERLVSPWWELRKVMGWPAARLTLREHLEVTV